MYCKNVSLTAVVVSLFVFALSFSLFGCKIVSSDTSTEEEVEQVDFDKNIPEDINNFVVYAKNDILYYYSLQADESIELMATTEIPTLMGNTHRYGFYSSADGKKFFYPKMEMVDGKKVPNLWCLDITDKTQKRIAKNVFIYQVNDTSDIVTYATHNNELYQYSFNGSEKTALLSPEVTGFLSSPNGKKIAYAVEGQLFLKRENSAAEELTDIDTRIFSIVHANETFSKFYFETNTDQGIALYSLEIGKQAKKITDSFSSNNAYWYPSGEVYFAKYENNSSNLYYCDSDGNCSLIDSAQFIGILDEKELYNTKTPMIAYIAENTRHLAIGGKKQQININDVSDMRITDDGSRVFAVAGSNRGNKCLYVSDIIDGKPGEFEIYPEGTNSIYISLNGNEAVHLKRNGANEYSLYDGKTKIGDYDSICDPIMIRENEIVFTNNYDNNSSTFTINSYSDSKCKTVADKVYNATVVTDNGAIIYCTDNGKKDLYIYKDGTNKLVAKDVHIDNVWLNSFQSVETSFYNSQNNDMITVPAF